MRAASPARPRPIYLITPPAFDPMDFAHQLADALAGGGVEALQLRIKPAGDDQAILAAYRAIVPVAEAHGTAIIMNDRLDLASRLGCAGVHVGAEDPSVEEARALLGPDAIIGATCQNSRHKAIVSAEKGADYVAFGSFFASTTKQGAVRAEPELLQWWSEMAVAPCVAIGGITPRNGCALLAHGADYLAVCSAIWSHPAGPGQAMRAFMEAIAISAPLSREGREGK